MVVCSSSSLLELLAEAVLADEVTEAEDVDDSLEVLEADDPEPVTEDKAEPPAEDAALVRDDTMLL